MSTLYQYPACDSCRKAKKWLVAHDIGFDAVHIVDHTPSVEALRDMWTRSGLPLKKLFNTSGQSYRKGNWKARMANISDDDALAALAADGKLIKRPLLDTGSTVLVGFGEASYGEALSGEQR
jgi:arsenate reductase